MNELKAWEIHCGIDMNKFFFLPTIMSMDYGGGVHIFFYFMFFEIGIIHRKSWDTMKGALRQRLKDLDEETKEWRP